MAVIKTPDRPLESCIIITRLPTLDAVEVHDRMLALLLSKDLEAWLDAPPAHARAAALNSWQPRILTLTPVQWPFCLTQAFCLTAVSRRNADRERRANA